MSKESKIILNHAQIEKKLYRLAFQLYEYFLDEKEIIVGGVNGNGIVLASHIARTLKEISGIRTLLVEIVVNKQDPKASGTTYNPELDVKNKPVVIVDDVLNTGQTMVHAVSPFIRDGSTSIKTLVLADRNHRRFPISADYIGISLATTLQEHLDFKVSGNEMTLYLR